MKAGLQLYNFRNELAADFKGALREIAKIGFDGVEFAVNYGGMEPDEIAAFLKELKLECAGAMFKADDIRDASNKVYDYARALNSPAVTHSLSTDFAAEYETVRANLEAAGKAAWQNGFVFAYHNHWREFELKDGVPAMDVILDNTDPVNVFMEADVCWLTRGGMDPAAWIRKYGSRIRQIHMKDIVVPDDPNTTAELGKGIVDLEAAAKAAHEIADCRWLIYEQDYTSDPFKSAEESLKYLRKLL